jgi:predicted nucleic acid-binding Zn ribbon protein
MAKRDNEMSVGEAIEAWLNREGLKEKSLVQRVISDWERIMGKPIAENTEKLLFKDGVFHIQMRHPVWRNELMLAQTKIREVLNKELGAELVKEVKIH